MHVKAKMMAFCGLLLALSVICMILGSVIEINTLFLLAAASFFTGIVMREFGKGAGTAFFLAGVILGLLLAPNKFYVVTYAGMSLYILVSEFAWEWVGKRSGGLEKKKRLLWLIKYVVFNVLYIPALIGFQKLFFGKTLEGIWLLLILLAGQVGLFLYDGAYEYVQRHLWKKMRRAIGFTKD